MCPWGLPIYTIKDLELDINEEISKLCENERLTNITIKYDINHIKDFNEEKLRQIIDKFKVFSSKLNKEVEIAYEVSNNVLVVKITKK